MDDILIIGGGPAGLSAAINTIARGGRCTVVSNPVEENPLWPARQVDNYPGMAGSTGAEILEKMHREAEEAGRMEIPEELTGDEARAWILGSLL